MSTPTARTVYLNGEFLPETEAHISIFDRGFLFADGIYEVTAVLDRKLIDSPLHMARLQRSVGEIGIELPVSIDEIIEIERKLIEANNVNEGLLYMQVTRGAQDRDFDYPHDLKPTLMIFPQHKNYLNAKNAQTGIVVKSVQDLRWARRDIKSLCLLPQVMVKHAAHAEGFDDVWMTEDGVITEGGSSTAYIVTEDKKIITRDNSHKILPGCTRAALVNLLKEQPEFTLEERAFTLEEALKAKEAFNTSATSFVLPIVKIDDTQIGDGKVGPVAKRLRELYVEHARKSAI